MFNIGSRIYIALMLSVLMLALVVLRLPALADNSDLPLRVVRVDGTAIFRADDRSPTAEIKISTDLSNGGQVRCTKGMLEITVYGEEVILKPADPWYTIGKPTAKQQAAWYAVEGNSHAAGSRGGFSGIYSPPVSDGVADPDSVVFRWCPQSGEIQSTATLSLGQQVIWRDDALDASTGELTSARARAALLKARELNPNATITFCIKCPGHDSMSSSFALLSSQDAQSLSTDLQTADAESSEFWRHIERAMAFRARRLYYEDSIECAAISALAPDRVDLRVSAIRALYATGNAPEAEALSTELPEDNPLRVHTPAKNSSTAHQ